MKDYRVREVIQKILSQLVVCLVLAVLIPADTETSEMFYSPNATVALTGDNVILPCSVRTPTSLAGLVVEWTRSDLKDTIVHINREGHDIEDQNPYYRGRTSMFPEELKNGNISLKLNNVKISDSGKYTCDVPSQDSVHKAVIQLVVGAVSQPVISILGPKDYGVVLKCDSGGWYPEPEMTWLDSDGNILSDGSTETGTDSEGRYTVRGHVTIHKTDNNRFTCRVLQQQINHKMETQIIVPDDTFPKSHGGLIAGVVIGILLAVVAGVVAFFMWRKKKQLKKYEKVTKNELEKKEKHMEELEVICVVKEEQAKRLENELEEQAKRLENELEEQVSTAKRLENELEEQAKKLLEEQEKLRKAMEEQEKLLKQQQEEADAVEFVRRHKDQIIKVNNQDVKVIAKELLENHLISLEACNKITEKTKMERMTKLYNIIDSGGPNMKLGFYRILKKHQPILVAKLDQRGSGSKRKKP